MVTSDSDTEFYIVILIHLGIFRVYLSRFIFILSMSENPTSPSAMLSDTEPETPNSRVSRNARRGVDPITSSPGRDLPAFENEDDLIGGMGGGDEEEEEDDGENLFGDDMENDYRAMPHLDQFDPNLLDEDEYENMGMDERAAAEALMRKRDRQEGRGEGRMRRGLLYDDVSCEDTFKNVTIFILTLFTG